MALLFSKEYNRRDCTLTKTKMDYEKVWTASVFTGSMQFPKGIDYINKPSGSYKDGTLIVYSNTKLAVRNEDNSEEKGTFVLSDEDIWLEITREIPYQMGGIFANLDHYKYVAEPRSKSMVGL